MARRGRARGRCGSGRRMRGLDRASSLWVNSRFPEEPRGDRARLYLDLGGQHRIMSVKINSLAPKCKNFRVIAGHMLSSPSGSVLLSEFARVAFAAGSAPCAAGLHGPARFEACLQTL